MDAYLNIAAKVLEAERRPLSPKAILDSAYKKSIVPPHLHGQTQHKTLQARISEDILQRHEHSLFYRTEPGRFFLRKFLSDRSLPEEFRVVFPARRRIRELVRGPCLAVEYALLENIGQRDIPIKPRKILAALRKDRYCYDDPRLKKPDLVFLRSFVCVSRNRELLSYRVGRYRDDRDTFMARRSIGFSTFVSSEDQTLFNLGDFGIIEAGVRATTIDLDIPETSPSEKINARLNCFIWSTRGSHSGDLLAVIDFECPRWFEPTKRRLALNDLGWFDSAKPVNDIDDFDPWSRVVLLAHFGSSSSKVAVSENDRPRSRPNGRRISEVSD